MSVLNLIKTSLYSIRSNKFRVFLTMVGIIIGISSTVAVRSIGDGLSRCVESIMVDSGSNIYTINFEFHNEELDTDTISCFDKNDINDITSITGVKKVNAVKGLGIDNELYGTISYFDKVYDSCDIIDYEEMKNKDLICGTWFNSANNRKKQIVLNYDVASKLFNKIEMSIGRGVTFNNEIYEVIGVLKKSKSISDMSYYYCFMSKENLKVLSKNDNISSIEFTVDRNSNFDEISNEIIKCLSRNHKGVEGEYIISDPSELVGAFSSFIDGLTSFIAAITGISLFVGGIGVMNIMYVSVAERKKEIGIRRAIGATPETILVQFLFEAIVVTFIAGILGIVLGILLGNSIGFFIPIEEFKVVITMKTLFGTTFISVLVGVIFGIVPAINASKLEPIKAIYK